MGKVTSFNMDSGLESTPDGDYLWWAYADFNGSVILNEQGKVDEYQQGFDLIGQVFDSKAQVLLDAQT